MPNNHRYSAYRPFYFRNLSSTVKLHLKKYERAQIRICNTLERKSFLKNCLDEQVTPQTIDVFINNNSNPFHPIRKMLIQDRLFSIKHELNQAFRDARTAYNNLR